MSNDKQQATASGASVYIYSTLSNDQAYTVHERSASGAAIATHVVHIKGKANVADRRTLVTPRGAVTVVTAEQAALLGKCDMFKRHVDRGFVTVSTSRGDADSVAADLAGRDKSAQATPADFAKAPVVNGEATPKADAE